MAFAALTARFFLAFLFLIAGASKLRGGALERTVERYGLLPHALVGPVATWLPRFEILCAVLLLLGLLTAPVAFVLAGLLFGFALAAAIVVVSGREVDCGCFGSTSSSPVRPLTAIRDLALAALALFVGIRPPSSLSFMSPGDGAVAAVSVEDAIAAPAAVASVMVAAAILRAARRLGPVPTRQARRG